MSEQKTMNIVIHAAFRRDLQRFESALAAFPDQSRARADQLAAAWANFSGQLHHHHQDEETIFWPVLRELGSDEALMSELEAEHHRMVTALASADAAIAVLAREPSSGSATAAHRDIVELTKVVDEHLVHEERDLEPFSTEKKEAPGMKKAQVAVRKAHKGEAGTFFAWLLDGASDADKAGLRREVPGPVLWMLVTIPGRDYRRRIAPTWA